LEPVAVCATVATLAISSTRFGEKIGASPGISVASSGWMTACSRPAGVAAASINSADRCAASTSSGASVARPKLASRSGS
jgi:hypothetical protein